MNSNHTPKFSVVVCIKNEEKRIEDCLKCILDNNPDEIIVVDGNSSDNSISICKRYTEKIVITQNSNLTRDRQIGIDSAKNDLIAMIDADHRLPKGSLLQLFNDLQTLDFDIIQSQIKSFNNNNWLNKAEEQMWDLNHNHAGPKKMIGVAPCIYKKTVFERVRFDDKITKTIDDTDFIYRVSTTTNLKYGVGYTTIQQYHDSNIKSYYHKFRWYGIGDGEFCIKHPSRTFSMMYHLFIRYPVVYSIKAIFAWKLLAVFFQIFQGLCRGFWAITTIFTIILKSKHLGLK